MGSCAIEWCETSVVTAFSHPPVFRIFLERISSDHEGAVGVGGGVVASLQFALMLKKFQLRVSTKPTRGIKWR